MANRRKKDPRKRFNPPSGRHTRSNKIKYRKHAKHVKHNLKELNLTFKKLKYKIKPYQISKVNYMSNGVRCVKFCVRRLRTSLRLKALSTPSPLRLSCINTSKIEEIDGRRLIEINKLEENVSNTTRHVLECDVAIHAIKEGRNAFNIVSEVRRKGLVSTLVFRCVCGREINMDTSNRVTSPSQPHLDTNLRAVWGAMVSGNGASPLNEVLATLGVPGISSSIFTGIETTIGHLWRSCIEEDMKKAGEEERRLAIERGDYHQGVPAITVVCDGGWSKRTHKHSYNALGGVAVIFGVATGKLLFLGVRNKHCHTCTLADTRKTEPPVHDCFKNWNDSSQAMEADIICEGFLEAESRHGVRFMRLIGDGDSSVYSRVQETVPVWGKDVKKMECANHSCKCLRASLEKLVTDKPQYKGRGKLTKLVRVRLTTAVRCAIRMRSIEDDKVKAVHQLELDIRNSIHHIFGNHKNCSDFCKARTSAAPPSSSSSSSSSTLSASSASISSSCLPDTESEIQDPSAISDEQCLFWGEGTSEQEMDESRKEISYEASVDWDIIRDVSILLDRIANKSERLIGNYTTNLAEGWMSVRMKFDGGKVINRCKRGSWHARCYGASLRKNFGPGWSPQVYQKCTNKRPGSVFTSLYRQRSFHLVKSLRSQKKGDVKERARKRKRQSMTVSSSKKARMEYGSDVVDTVPDVSKNELQERCTTFCTENVAISDAKCDNVEKHTKDQSMSTTWKEERKLRLTASVFGEVVHRNPHRPTSALVKRLLYSSYKGNKYTEFGLAQESSTIMEYRKFHEKKGENVVVQNMGLMIDKDNKFLAASTDGLVICSDRQENGLLEIKNLLQRNTLSFEEAAVKLSSFCLEKSPSGESLQLKRHHNYYFQCQGQLNIFKLPWIDFIVRRLNPYQLHIERVYQDKDLWRNTMLPKLKAFYMKAILPELAMPRCNLNPGIREPDMPWFIPVHSPVGEICRKSSEPKKQQPSATFSGKRKATTVCPSPSPGCSSTPDFPRTRRRRRTKFVGRKISHEWCVDEATGKNVWYTGIVLECVKGKDGDADADAEYDIKYEGETETFRVNNLQEDLDNSSLRFIDI